jgi:hypothetical protein
MEERMLPRKKNQTLENYAQAAAFELTLRVQMLKSTQGANAAWRAVIAEIRKEGQYVREASPSATLIYQMYVVIAMTLLREDPDDQKTRELVECVRGDLSTQLARVPSMKPGAYTQGEYSSIRGALLALEEDLRDLAKLVERE